MRRVVKQTLEYFIVHTRELACQMRTCLGKSVRIQAVTLFSEKQVLFALVSTTKNGLKTLKVAPYFTSKLLTVIAHA